MTVTGLNSVLMNDLTTWQQVMLFVSDDLMLPPWRLLAPGITSANALADFRTA